MKFNSPDDFYDEFEKKNAESYEISKKIIDALENTDNSYVIVTSLSRVVAFYIAECPELQSAIEQAVEIYKKRILLDKNK